MIQIEADEYRHDDEGDHGNDADSCLFCLLGGGDLSIGIALTYPFTTVPPLG